MSAYLEGDLDAEDRRAFEAHVRRCGRCRRLLASLASTLRALGSIAEQAPKGLADSIIDALRAESPATSLHVRSRNASPVLTVLPGLSEGAGARVLARWPRSALAALRWCLQRPRLRLTLPITFVAGAVLSVVNMGGMLIHGRIDLGVCLSCAVDFLVPFVALNLGLLMLFRVPGGRASGPA
jgi:anti-sigma factor RsiW